MRMLITEYQTPQLVEQGSAITLTAASDTGSCWDGCPVSECGQEYNECPCSGSGSSCARETE